MVELVDVVDVKGIIAYDIGSGGQARLLIFGSAKVVVVEVLGAYHLLLHRCGEAYATTRGYQKWHIGHSLRKMKKGSKKELHSVISNLYVCEVTALVDSNATMSKSRKCKDHTTQSFQDQRATTPQR